MPRKPYVVNVGLPRTGTKSFIEAVVQLGFLGRQIWPKAEQSPEFFERLMAHRPRPAIEMQHFDAWADTPFYAMRKLFDKHYPHTQLVYTTRDKESWINSMIGHTKAGGEFLRNLYQIDEYPWSPNSADALEELYDKHHANVCQGLPMIHLENMHDRDKWEVLCRALPKSRRLLRSVDQKPWPNIG